MFSKLQQPYIIAEISGNHNGSIDRAKELIKIAKDCGASCVKLQTYSPETMTLNSDKKDFLIEGGLWDGYKLWDLYEWAQTPFEWHEELFRFSKEVEIECISTPFDESAVDLLEDLNTPFYKIASFEVTDLPLVKYIASTGKPIIMSTGMANESEISEAVEIIKKYNKEEFMLLHCISGYPTPIEDINLNTIKLLRDKFNCEIGLSDHTLGTFAASVSIGLGVKVIEKHFTFDRSEGGPDAAFSLEPAELKELVDATKRAHVALGEASYKIKDAERENLKFRRSIYVSKDIKSGDILTKENIKRVRPGYGMEPKYYNDVLGKKAKNDLEAGSPLLKEHIEK